MHVPNESKILLVPRSHADGRPPFLYELEYFHLSSGGVNGRSFGESTDKLIEELLGADLEVECVAAIFDANI
jgi:hypothetical protein